MIPIGRDRRPDARYQLTAPPASFATGTPAASATRPAGACPAGAAAIGQGPGATGPGGRAGLALTCDP